MSIKSEWLNLLKGIITYDDYFPPHFLLFNLSLLEFQPRFSCSLPFPPPLNSHWPLSDKNYKRVAYISDHNYQIFEIKHMFDNLEARS